MSVRTHLPRLEHGPATKGPESEGERGAEHHQRTACIFRRDDAIDRPEEVTDLRTRVGGKRILLESHASLRGESSQEVQFAKHGLLQHLVAGLPIEAEDAGTKGEAETSEGRSEDADDAKGQGRSRLRAALPESFGQLTQGIRFVICYGSRRVMLPVCHPMSAVDLAVRLEPRTDALLVMA